MKPERRTRTQSTALQSGDEPHPKPVIPASSSASQPSATDASLDPGSNPHGTNAAGAAARPEARSEARSQAAPRHDNARPLRVALVGAGFIADFHLAILKEIAGVEIAAVCDSDVVRAEALARRYGIARSVRSIDELPALSVDVAHLCVPPDLHVALTKQLIEHGIGTFVEKPLALESRHARELAQLAAGRKVALGANHNNLFHPSFSRLLERVNAGEIGRVEHVQATLSVPLMQLDAGDFAHWMFRAPRNIVFEQAVHPLCQVHALIGRVKSAHTTLLGTRELNPGQIFHDRWAIDAKGERGTAQIYLAFGQGFTRSTLQVIGSDGSLEADLYHDHLSGETKTPWLDFWNSFLAGWRRGNALKRDARRGLFHYLGFTLGLSRREDAFFVGMRESIRAFHAALAAHRAPPTDGEQAAQVLEWCEAVAQGVPASGPPEAKLPEPGPARPGEVVVLGATGFIGRRTIAKLLGANLPVTVIARRTHSLPPEITAAAQSGKLRFFRGQFEVHDALEKALTGARTLLHLATGGGDTWEKVERAMVKGSVELAEIALACKVERFVYVSSIAALYTGGDAGTDAIEDSLATDPRPGTRPLYTRGKIAAEQALSRMAKERGLALTIVRPGVVLGRGTPMQHSGLGHWPRDNHCIGWGGGEHPLPVVWVDDVADALVKIAQYKGRELDGLALNLCARVPLSAREIVAELSRSTGRDLHFHPRALALAQAMEIGKWLVKKAGRRPGIEFPSWRDLKARSLASSFTARTAREVLGWKPVEDREVFLDRAVRIHGRGS
jgi:predicted dehydrogenase/nucleoside-diphosphate-sugar epimerase